MDKWNATIGLQTNNVKRHVTLRHMVCEALETQDKQGIKLNFQKAASKILGKCETEIPFSLIKFLMTWKRFNFCNGNTSNEGKTMHRNCESSDDAPMDPNIAEAVVKLFQSGINRSKSI